MTNYNHRDLLSRTQGELVFFEWFCDNPVIGWDAGLMLVKNLNHQFVASNSTFTNYSGYHPKEIVGLSDNDMPWAEHKSIYIGHEKDIISGLDYSVIEPLSGLIKANLLTKKKVIYSKDGSPAGIIATAIVFNGFVEYGNLAGSAVKMKVSDYSGYYLTAHESKLLYFLLKGFSRKKVSELAGVSTSSYDFHVRNIKLKFNVETMDELVFICYEKGFHDFIPYQAVM